jgi:hypothetical protein
LENSLFTTNALLFGMVSLCNWLAIIKTDK